MDVGDRSWWRQLVVDHVVDGLARVEADWQAAAVVCEEEGVPEGWEGHGAAVDVATEVTLRRAPGHHADRFGVDGRRGDGLGGGEEGGPSQCRGRQERDQPHRQAGDPPPRRGGSGRGRLHDGRGHPVDAGNHPEVARLVVALPPVARRSSGQRGDGGGAGVDVQHEGSTATETSSP